MGTPESDGGRRVCWWNVGYLAPRLIALALVLEIGLRMMPSGWVDLGLWENAYALSDEAFARNAHIETRETGDLSWLGNLPNRRIYRSMSATTDDIGFRNAGSMRNVAGIVVGDSFGIAGSSNEHDLAPQLGRRTGCPVYNATGARLEIQAPAPERVVELARYLGMSRGVVVVERLERLGSPPVPKVSSETPRLGRSPSIVERARTWAAVSPARLLAENAFRRLLDDRIFPNVHRDAAVEKTLSSGDWMLFYRDEMKNYDQERLVSTEYWTKLRAGLDAASLGLLVVLVPDKYTVYHRHLLDATSTLVPPEQFLAAMESALRSAGIPVVNLTEAFQREAAAGLSRKTYIYHRDDTHWNDLGIAVAAREIAQAWRASGGPPCR
jgi:SGNH hydrolase-like domain, acetyltransferase AlgX